MQGHYIGNSKIFETSAHLDIWNVVSHPLTRLSKITFAYEFTLSAYVSIVCPCMYKTTLNSLLNVQYHSAVYCEYRKVKGGGCTHMTAFMHYQIHASAPKKVLVPKCKTKMSEYS